MYKNISEDKQITTDICIGRKTHKKETAIASPERHEIINVKEKTSFYGKIQELLKFPEKQF